MGGINVISATFTLELRCTTMFRGTNSTVLCIEGICMEFRFGIAFIFTFSAIFSFRDSKLQVVEETGVPNILKSLYTKFQDFPILWFSRVIANSNWWDRDGLLISKVSADHDEFSN